MPIKITYAILDVRGDRTALINRVRAGEEVRYTLSGTLTRTRTDDGVGMGFDAHVNDFDVEGEERD
jgi:hypothetical protein